MSEHQDILQVNDISGSPFKNKRGEVVKCKRLCVVGNGHAHRGIPNSSQLMFSHSWKGETWSDKIGFDPAREYLVIEGLVRLCKCDAVLATVIAPLSVRTLATAA